MPITFSGDIPSASERVLTRSWSLNKALRDQLGNEGLPLRSLIELYGPKGTGKTSFALSILGDVATKREKGISILDLEIQSRETVKGILEYAGYSSDVYYIQQKSDELSEDTVERFCDRMFDIQGEGKSAKKTYDNPDVGLMDSIGAYRPGAEIEGKIGDANMGIKAREMGQISSRFIRALQLAKNPHTIFMTNHEHPNMSIGFGNPAPITSGGETKKYLSQIRIRLTEAYVGKSPARFDGAWLIEGKVNENRFGISDQKFWCFVIGGQGIHAGLTAAFECLVLGYADASAQALRGSTAISLDGFSYGKIDKLIRNRDDDELFKAFHNRLRVETVEEDDTEIPVPKKGKKK